MDGQNAGVLRRKPLHKKGRAVKPGLFYWFMADGKSTSEISDFGCGMDEQTLQKAMYPFFSNLPAGQKRGMGLAHAARLIQLNGGSLSITSIPGTGTTVSILLPCK